MPVPKMPANTISSGLLSCTAAVTARSHATVCYRRNDKRTTGWIKPVVRLPKKRPQTL